MIGDSTIAILLIVVDNTSPSCCHNQVNRKDVIGVAAQPIKQAINDISWTL